MFQIKGFRNVKSTAYSFEVKLYFNTILSKLAETPSGVNKIV